MQERFDEVIKDYIDFVNAQVGVYIDALAGFEGHRTEVERQVHRVRRPTKSYIDAAGQQAIVWASYEDSSKPDIIHSRILRAEDYLAANTKGGSNEQQHSKAILIFIFTYWEDEIRPRAATSRGVARDEIRSDIMGDLRIVRHAILHAKSIIRAGEHKRMKRLAGMLPADQPLVFSFEGMHTLFELIKQDCARMLFDWLGVKAPAVQPEQIVDVALQLARRANEPKS